MPEFLESEYGLFRDEKEFLKLKKKGRIYEGQQIKYNNYDECPCNQKRFVVGLELKLYDEETKKEVAPEKVLRNKDGWYFIGAANSINFSEEEISRIEETERKIKERAKDQPGCRIKL